MNKMNKMNKKTNQTEFSGHNDSDTMLDIVCEDGYL